MNSISPGIAQFLEPLAFWLLVAVIVEWMASKRSHEWNIWLTSMALFNVLFRLYWVMWLSTIRISDIPQGYDPVWAREKMMLTLFLPMCFAGFGPTIILSLIQIWKARERCGRWLSLIRFVPVVAFAYLFCRAVVCVLRIMDGIHTPY